MAHFRFCICVVFLFVLRCYSFLFRSKRCTSNSSQSFSVSASPCLLFDPGRWDYCKLKHSYHSLAAGWTTVKVNEWTKYEWGWEWNEEGGSKRDRGKRVKKAPKIHQITEKLNATYAHVRTRMYANRKKRKRKSRHRTARNQNERLTVAHLFYSSCYRTEWMYLLGE